MTKKRSRSKRTLKALAEIARCREKAMQFLEEIARLKAAGRWPVVEVTDSMIVVRKGKDRWEIKRHEG